MLDEILLEKLARWRPGAAGATLDAVDAPGGWSASLDAGAVDSLGVSVNRLTVRPVTATPAGTLREQADRLAGRVTGLLEPLRVVEVDEPHGVAQLRSDAPARADGAARYYEVERHADGTTHLGRYESRPGQGKREAVPFTVTREALGKIVRDFAG